MPKGEYFNSGTNIGGFFVQEQAQSMVNVGPSDMQLRLSCSHLGIGDLSPFGFIPCLSPF